MKVDELDNGGGHEGPGIHAHRKPAGGRIIRAKDVASFTVDLYPGAALMPTDHDSVRWRGRS